MKRQRVFARACRCATQRNHLPDRDKLFDLHRGVLEFGLPGCGIEHRHSDGVDAGAAHELPTPMHGHEGLTGAHGVGRVGARDKAAAPAADLDQITRAQTTPRHVLRVQVELWFSDVIEQARYGTGAAHAVPLVAQATGVEANRIACVGRFSHGLRFSHDETGAAGQCGENAVFVKPRLAACGALRERPLLRTGLIKQRVGKTGDVEVATARGFAMFVENFFRRRIGKEALRQSALPQLFTERFGEIDGDAPVVTRFAGRRHGGVDMGDTPLRVGHGAFLLAPTRGGQQQVGIGGGVGMGIGFLHHHEFAGGECGVHLVGVRHGLRRVGTGDPQRLDLARMHRVEQFNCSEARRFGHFVDAPEFFDFGAMLRIGQIAMRRKQRGQTADLAPAHGIGLAGERERTATRLADLAGGEMQLDQRGIVVRALA